MVEIIEIIETEKDAVKRVLEVLEQTRKDKISGVKEIIEEEINEEEKEENS